MISSKRILLYNIFVFLSIFCRLTKSEYSTNEPNTSDTTTMSTNTLSNIYLTSTTSAATVANSSMSTDASNSTSTSSVSITTVNTTRDTTTSISSSTLSNVVDDRSSNNAGRWLLFGVLITIGILIIAGVIFYYKRQSPYRRFLRNWRSRDDGADNIILQLEQSEMAHDQWPPRISFS